MLERIVVAIADIEVTADLYDGDVRFTSPDRSLAIRAYQAAEGGSSEVILQPGSLITFTAGYQDGLGVLAALYSIDPDNTVLVSVPARIQALVTARLQAGAGSLGGITPNVSY